MHGQRNELKADFLQLRNEFGIEKGMDREWEWEGKGDGDRDGNGNEKFNQHKWHIQIQNTKYSFAINFMETAA